MRLKDYLGQEWYFSYNVETIDLLGKFHLDRGSCIGNAQDFFRINDEEHDDYAIIFIMINEKKEENE